MTAETLRELFAPPADDSLAAAARSYLSYRDRADAAEDALKIASGQLKAAEDALLQAMQAAGVSSLKIDAPNGGSSQVTAVATKYYSLAQAMFDDPTVLEWLTRAGGIDLIKRTVHAQSFGAFCREIAEAGHPLHEQVKVLERKSVRVKKG